MEYFHHNKIYWNGLAFHLIAKYQYSLKLSIPNSPESQMVRSHNGAYRKFLLGVVLINVVEM